jgi:hypothetical protein
LTASAAVVASVTSPGQILALPGASESTVVTVEPTRVLDTRFGVGLTDKLKGNTPQKLQITGVIETYVASTETRTDKEVVPHGATGVLMNVTAVSPTGIGNLSVRPGNATGVPATAGLNFNAGDTVPNAITMALPAIGTDNAGQIDLYYGTEAAANTMDVVIDIVGYTTNTGLIDLVQRVEALESTEAEATDTTYLSTARFVPDISGCPENEVRLIVTNFGPTDVIPPGPTACVERPEVPETPTFPEPIASFTFDVPAGLDPSRVYLPERGDPLTGPPGQTSVDTSPPPAVLRGIVRCDGNGEGQIQCSVAAFFDNPENPAFLRATDAEFQQLVDVGWKNDTAIYQINELS